MTSTILAHLLQYPIIWRNVQVQTFRRLEFKFRFWITFHFLKMPGAAPEAEISFQEFYHKKLIYTRSSRHNTITYFVTRHFGDNKCNKPSQKCRQIFNKNKSYAATQLLPCLSETWFMWEHIGSGPTPKTQGLPLSSCFTGYIFTFDISSVLLV